MFISGSRIQEVLPQMIDDSLQLIMKQRIKVLIGDSDKGVDQEILAYVRDTYDLVEIFTIAALEP